MWTVEQGVQDLLEGMELTQPQREAVTRQHEVVCKVLRERLKLEEQFLSGSYGRGTAIRPLHDVDLFVVMDPTRFPRDDSSPDALLQQVRGAFMQEWSERKPPTPQRHSLGLDFTTSGIHIDVVPAYKGSRGGYVIPQRDTGMWIPTDPKVHEVAGMRADEKAGHRLNHLIKLVKQWNRNQASSPLRSFHLEVMSHEAFTSMPRGSYLEVLEVLFQFLSERVMRPCVDPAGLGNAVDARMDEGRRREFARDLLRGAAQTVQLAFAERLVNPESAHARLAEFFGPMYRKRAP
ncbi:nucleotidyltransferase [Myxococcus sp. CA033]|uniref:nucleotidyltransferase domain-containing protein n=1 Tax=Myxococcus sp. CA033 TaxID=2741516 RepID=UPI00157ADF7D|nr:nucleotidyltransferase [Myxococcus sp. CA033]NTX41329.1 nucleotidyltransferase [Myxococcus sp. CA033]